MAQQASSNADGYNLIGENPYINSMPTRRPSVLGRGLWGLAVTLLFLLLSATALAAVTPPEEVIPLGESRERPIAAGEEQAWRVTVPPDTTVLVTVDQHSIDLVVEARRPGGKEPLAVTASRDSWATEVLLLDSSGETRIEVRSREKGVWPGRYTLHVEALPERTGARRDALALMSKAGRETLPNTPESQRQAEVTYRDALAKWRSLGEHIWEAEALSSLGMLEAEASDLRPATQDFLATLELWQELRQPQREAGALNWLGVIYLYTQGTEKARESWERSLSLWQSLGERFDEAQTRYNLCSMERAQGSLPEALACFQKNLAFFQEIGDLRQEAEIFNSLGGVYDLQGEPDDALDSYKKALALWHTLGDHNREAATLNNIAVVHRTLGEWQEALRLYDRSGEALGPNGDIAVAASRLSNMGVVYNSVGEPRRAVGYLQDALKLRRKVGDRSGEIITLNNLGTAWRKLGDPVRALDLHRQALDLAASQKDVGQQATSRLRLAEVYFDRGNASAALRDLDAALALLAKKGNRRIETELLHQKGRALALAGRAREALPTFQEALAGRHALRDRAGEAETLYELARVERALGQGLDALSHTETAVTRVEELRTGFLNADLRASFLATRRHAFSLLIDLLMDLSSTDPGKSHLQEAFAISERARARGLLDVLRAGRTGSTVPPELLKRRTDLLRRLSAKIEQRWKQSGERAAALQVAIDAILTEVDAVEADIRRQDTRFAAFSSPKPVGPEEISNWLEPGTMLLEYSLGEDRSFLWTIEAGQIHAYILPGQKEIEDRARQVYEEMSTVEAGNSRRGKAAEDLSRILLGPIWSEAARLGRLVVVPDGALGVLPFAALPVPDPGRSWKAPGTLKPLLERLEVVYIPSATTLAVQRQRLERRVRASKWAAVLADPVFTADDSRLAHRSAALSPAPGKKKATESWLRDPGTKEPTETPERLPSTRLEADAIAGLAPPGQVWRGLGLEANREFVLSGGLRDYRTLHFATHAVANTSNPELSGLVLSQVDAEGHPRDGFLGLLDIYDLDFDADLVVLSGCQTALGKEVRGEGLMGLTRGFQYAGVPRVVASLWRVQDRATAELMTHFYKAMWRDNLPAAAALRKAQISLRRVYRDPYFWAGFVLQGDWHRESAENSR